jgi:hypothetical protein
MAKQDTRGDAPKMTDEQVSDILLVMDKKELSLQAVSQIDKNGKAKTVSADREHQNDFLRIDWASNIVSSFLSNFWRQVKDPSRYPATDRQRKRPRLGNYRDFPGGYEQIKQY